MCANNRQRLYSPSTLLLWFWEAMRFPKRDTRAAVLLAVHFREGVTAPFCLQVAGYKLRFTETKAPVGVAVLDHGEHDILRRHAAAFGKAARHELVECLLHLLRPRARRHVDQDALFGAFEAQPGIFHNKV
ncbi:Hypothetical protein GbCGDNIH9_8739 [Granulibacter bethesdensis]|uniref:Uncharacterized protein n=1 Tax=Granulibacter bethesdensis TaxID=364410 RepID=A0AAC9KBI2_9PROT|nr:Hypothetical protein GbCGDNIH9_8739 [Granulibacter bethesdensis]